MVPYPENDHSILPDGANERFYLDYGPLFNALRARTWVLRTGVVEAGEGSAKTNVFETPEHYIVFVGLGGQQKAAQLKLNGITGIAKVLYPGQASDEKLRPREEAGVAVFDVLLKRGCAMLLFDKKAANIASDEAPKAGI
jgi:hypothetical protein